jgi:hypothetical protein
MGKNGGAVTIVLTTHTATARHGHTPSLKGIDSIYFCCLHVSVIG